MLSRGYEYMDLDQDLDLTPDATPNGHERVGATVSSDQGAGPLGFAGTAAKDTGAQVGGLATLAHDSFGGGPTMPMVPDSWTPGSSAD